MGLFKKKTPIIVSQADIEAVDIELRETTLERLADHPPEPDSGPDGEVTSWLWSYSTYALTVPSEAFLAKLSDDDQLRAFAEGVGEGFQKSWAKESSRFKDVSQTSRDVGTSRLMRSLEMATAMQPAILAGLGWPMPESNAATIKTHADAGFVWDLAMFYVGDARFADATRRVAAGRACGYRIADWSMWTTHQGIA